MSMAEFFQTVQDFCESENIKPRSVYAHIDSPFPSATLMVDGKAEDAESISAELMWNTNASDITYADIVVNGIEVRVQLYGGAA